MPPRTAFQSFQGLLNGILERLRLVERMHSTLEQELALRWLRCFTWQSTFSLVTGLGHKFYTESDGEIMFVRAERSAADGTATAIMDLLLNGQSVFPDGNFPTVDASKGLGLEKTPRVGADFGVEPAPFPRGRRFKRGDSLQVNVLNTGGGSGPLRLTIHFAQTAPLDE